MASRRFPSKMLPYSVVPALALLVTWLTSFYGVFLEHGLPFPWEFGGCPGDHILMACVLNITYDWAAFTLDVLFYSAIGYGAFLVYPNYQAWKVRKSLASGASIEDRRQSNLVQGKMTLPLHRLSNLGVIAVLVTFLTGNFFGIWTMGLGNFFFVWGLGFPVFWITGGCPPWPGVQIACSGIGYSLLGFLLDTLFFTGVGYGLLRVYSKYQAGFPTVFPPGQT